MFKHVDVLKTLKGEGEGIANLPTASTSAPAPKTNSNIGAADLHNVCTTLLQGGNTYDASTNSFNIMATLQGIIVEQLL
jgi:hypothetical protein